MALTDTKLRNLKPGKKAYQEADEGGLFVEVMPGGAKVWRLRYRLAGKQEKVTLGGYPTYSLGEARTWRDDCKALAGRGLSPMALKRGDPVPGDAAPAVKEMAQAFIRDWCLKTREKAKAEAAKKADTAGAANVANRRAGRARNRPDRCAPAAPRRRSRSCQAWHSNALSPSALAAIFSSAATTLRLAASISPTRAKQVSMSPCSLARNAASPASWNSRCGVSISA